MVFPRSDLLENRPVAGLVPFQSYVIMVKIKPDNMKFLDLCLNTESGL